MAYVLWPFEEKLIFAIVAQYTVRDSTVYIACNTMENLPLISNEFIQEANLWSQSQSEETFMITLRSIRDKLPYLCGYLVVTTWNLIEALIENGIDDFQA